MIQRKSFSAKLGFLLFCVIVLPVLIITIFTYHRLSASIQASSQALNESNLQSMAHSMEQYFQSYEELTDKILISRSIRAIAASADDDRYAQLMNDRAFSEEIKAFTLNDYDLECVYLFTVSGGEYYEGYNLENLNLEQVREKCRLSLTEQPVYSSQVSYDAIFVRHENTTQCKILLLRPLLNYQNGRYLGVIALQMAPNVLPDLLGYAEDITFLLSASGQILYDSTGLHCEQSFPALTQSEAPRLYDSGDYAQTGISLPSGWQIVQLKEYRSVTDRVYTAVLPLFAVSILCVFLFLVIAIELSRWLTAPIQTLQAAMRKVETGDMTQHVQIHTHDELEDLGNAYNHMLDQLNHYIRKAYDEELQHVKAEYRALQSQINPHFLYNSLESINSLAQIHHQPQISQMICCLADVFRYTTKQTDHLVPLYQELQHVKNYITLQSIPYASGAQAVYRIPETLQNFAVPKMILQPVVENCFNHAADGSAQPFTITLSAEEVPEGLVLRVQDNGGGIPAARLQELTAQLENARSDRPDSSCVGLINVCQRLRFIFQPGSGVELYSREGAGTTVLLKMYRRAQKKEGGPCTRS